MVDLFFREISSNLSSWVQAIGSILAVLAALLIFFLQNLSVKKEKRMEKDFAIREAEISILSQSSYKKTLESLESYLIDFSIDQDPVDISRKANILLRNLDSQLMRLLFKIYQEDVLKIDSMINEILLNSTNIEVCTKKLNRGGIQLGSRGLESIPIISDKERYELEGKVEIAGNKIIIISARLRGYLPKISKLLSKARVSI